MTRIEVTATFFEQDLSVDIPCLSQFVWRAELDFLFRIGIHKRPHDVDECSNEPREIHKVAESEVFGIVRLQDVERLASDLELV